MSPSPQRDGSPMDSGLMAPASPDSRGGKLRSAVPRQTCALRQPELSLHPQLVHACQTFCLLSPARAGALPPRMATRGLGTSGVRGRPGRFLRVEDRHSPTEMVVLSSWSARCGPVSVTHCTAGLILVPQSHYCFGGKLHRVPCPSCLYRGGGGAEHTVDGVAVDSHESGASVCGLRTEL